MYTSPVSTIVYFQPTDVFKDPMQSLDECFRCYVDIFPVETGSWVSICGASPILFSYPIECNSAQLPTLSVALVQEVFFP